MLRMCNDCAMPWGTSVGRSKRLGKEDITFSGECQGGNVGMYKME